jgi:hypothetical protein
VRVAGAGGEAGVLRVAARLLVGVAVGFVQATPKGGEAEAAVGEAAKQARIEAIIKAGGTPPPVNKGGRPRSIPTKVTPTVAGMILKMKAERKKVTVIARELNLSRQTVYDVLKRA